MDDDDTGFHDHDGSAGAVAVAAGVLLEERIVLDGAPNSLVIGPRGVDRFRRLPPRPLAAARAHGRLRSERGRRAPARAHKLRRGSPPAGGLSGVRGSSGEAARGGIYVFLVLRVWSGGRESYIRTLGGLVCRCHRPRMRT